MTTDDTITIKIPPNIFFKAASWIEFAASHNKKSSNTAKPLNGSQSYTLVAIHAAAGVPIPESIRLDSQRRKGVSDHFQGLRQAYENSKNGFGISPSRGWLGNILEECNKFAKENSLDEDNLIKKVIELTERSSFNEEFNKKIALQMSENANTAFKTLCLPTKADIEFAESQLRESPKEEVGVSATLDQVEKNLKSAGKLLKENWRYITEQNIEIWFSRKESKIL